MKVSVGFKSHHQRANSRYGTLTPTKRNMQRTLPLLHATKDRRRGRGGRATHTHGRDILLLVQTDQTRMAWFVSVGDEKRTEGDNTRHGNADKRTTSDHERKRGSKDHEEEEEEVAVKGC